MEALYKDPQLDSPLVKFDHDAPSVIHEEVKNDTIPSDSISDTSEVNAVSSLWWGVAVCIVRGWDLRLTMVSR